MCNVDFRVVRICNMKIRYTLQKAQAKTGAISYGIKVQQGRDAVFIKDITSSFTAAHALFESMVHGSVTPVTAKDIVEDWLLR